MSVVETIVSTVIDGLQRTPRAVIAVSGPQGSGKTTATKKAAELLTEKHNVAVVAISLDDFYKPYSELQQLASHGNPLLKHRGLPGTHDVHLALELIRDFKAGRGNLKVPVYDKSAHSGAGDRTGSIEIPDSTRAILLEGWMVGFRPIGKAHVEQKAEGVAEQPWSVKPTAANLLEIDNNLQSYTSLWDECDGFVRITPEKLDYVYRWRLQQEHEMLKVKGSGMTDDQVKQFVDQYMPCYYLYNETLPDSGVTLGPDHNVVIR